MQKFTENSEVDKPLSKSTRGLLSKYNFTPKKKLGQNFMIDRNSVDRIVDAAELSKDDLVLEIGTGLGTLTRALAEKAGKVISVEYDKVLFEIAKDVLDGVNNIDLVREDFLKLDLKKLLEKPSSYKIVGNLPYYITAPIITKLIEAKPVFSKGVITVQKEVAERLTAKPGTREYGTLSIFVQYHLIVSIVSFIAKSSFLPHPQVTSAIVVMEPREKPLVKVENEELFFRIIHASFEHRRKTLRNSILMSKKFDITKEKLDRALSAAGINGERRGETLSPEEFAGLSDALA